MRASRTCDRCGAVVPPSAPQSLCLRCLFDTAVDPSTDIPGEQAPSGAVPEFADYELLGELGRGGQGVVYRAKHAKLGRLVALKTIPSAHVSGPNARERFLLEANTAARLDHPNIVPIYEVGERDGFCFFSMKLIEGMTLQQWSGQALPGGAGCRQAATILIKVARAIHHAHQRGVLHRDLKPSNILLDSEHEPHVTDFGLARRTDQDTALTLTEAIIGTPAYMAPEVATGGSRQATVFSDVYGLGAILYQVLTGKPPFGGGTISETLRALQEQDPTKPKALNGRIPNDLETICLKCLEKKPAKRYSTAEALAEDLNRFLQHEPILARPIGRAASTWRWCRRKPVLASLLAALTVVFTLGLAGIVWEWRRAVAGELLARRHQYVADMNVVQQDWEEGRLKRAQDRLNAYIPEPGEADLRGFEWRYLWKRCRDESKFSFTNFPAGIHLVVSPDGRFAAAGSGRVVKLLDFVHDRELDTLEVTNITDEIRALAFSPADANVLAVSSGKECHLWNLAERRMTATIKMSKPASGLAISSDGKYLATASEDQHTIALWQLANGSVIWERDIPGTTSALSFAPDGKSLITGGGLLANPISWDLANGTSHSFITERLGNITGMSVSPDGQTLATGSTDGAVMLWDLVHHKLITRLVRSGANTAVPAFSPDGRFLAVGYADSTIRLWDVQSHQQQAVFRGHKADIVDVAFSSKGDLIVSSSDDGTVKVWDAEPHSNEEILARCEHWVSSSNFSPDGKRLAVWEFGGGFSIWNVPERHRIIETQPPNDGKIASFSPNGKVLAQALDRTINLWDANTGVLQAELTNGFDAISLSFSPDSRILAAAGLTASEPVLDGITNRLAFWDLAAKRRMEKLAAAAPLAVIVSFSHDGKKVAVGYLDGQVRLWNYETEKLLAEFTEQHQRIWAVAFSHDDYWLAAGGNEGMPFFYEVRSRRALRPLTGASDWVIGLCFTPDGKTVASAEGDGTINLWNMATREIALTLRGHEGWLSVGPAFSPDGNLLATSGADGTVRLWPAASLEEIPHRKGK